MQKSAVKALADDTAKRKVDSAAVDETADIVDVSAAAEGHARRPVVAVRIAFVLGLLVLGVFIGAEAGLFGREAVKRGAVQGAAERSVATGLTRYAADRPESPPLRGTTLDGGRFDLAALRGEVVVINTWGSWCNPCRAEAPDLVRAANETERSGVRFVGIDTRDNAPAARAFERSFKIPYPSVIDTDGRVLLAFNELLPVNAVPSTLVVDRDGRVAARVIGRVDYATVRGLVDDVLAEGPPSEGGAR